MIKSFLKSVGIKKEAVDDETSSNPTPDLELGRLTVGDEDRLLSLFLEKVASIEMEIEDLHDLLLDLRLLNEDNKSTGNPLLLRRIANQIGSYMIAVLRKVQLVNNQLKILDDANTANRQISPIYAEGSRVDHIRISVTCGIRKNLWGTMHEFRGLMVQIVADHWEGLRGRYLAVTGKLPNTLELEELITANVGMKFVSNTVYTKLVSEVMERRRAVGKLLRSFKKLQKILQGKEVALVECEDIVGCPTCYFLFTMINSAFLVSFFLSMVYLIIKGMFFTF